MRSGSSTPSAASGGRFRSAASVGLRGLLFGGIWIVLGDGNPRGWGLGLVVIAIAVWTSLRLLPPSRDRTIAWRGLVRFVPYFLYASLRGATDVATRAFRSPPAVDPTTVDLHLRLPAVGPARVFFTAVVGLLPGTLGTARTGEILTIHVVDRGSASEGELRRLENRVADLFGIALARPD
jgi:multicomponent Na+:H+ antiporter subunit E